MSALKIHLIRAACDWAIEQGWTPHVMVDATVPGTQVPTAYVNDGRIVVNVHPRAVTGLALNDDGVACSARFGGRSVDLIIPAAAILAVYAKENGQGISFPEKEIDSPATPPDPAPKKPTRKTPSLKIIK